MFKYFHCYNSQIWEGQIRNNFINKNAGIRFHHTAGISNASKFNEMAVKGGEFYNIIKELKLPMYIDRLQGGSAITDYKFDKNLIEEYENILGDDFYGMQFHETASNCRNDLIRINKDPNCDWTAEGIKKSIYKNYPYEFLFLEAFRVEEYAQIGPIDDAEKFHKVIDFLYESRSEKYKLLPADSFIFTYKLAFEKGIQRIMPEVGAQTPDTRLQIVYASSLAKSYGRHFGIYYEPWGLHPVTVCNYHCDNMNEWGTDAYGPYESAGENGGSSRSLQKRIHYYAYLSGAEFISEEWGGFNTFKNRFDFELSEYGLVKKRFLDFVEKYPDVGRKITPVAVVIPKELNVLSDIHFDTWCKFPVYGDKKRSLDRIKKTLCDIFSNPTSDMNISDYADYTVSESHSENYSLINSEIPDAIDLVHDDSPNLSDYEYLIDATQKPDFAKKYSNICKSEDLQQILEKTLPCKVEGGLHWMVNKCGDKFYLAIFNNFGIKRTIAEGETVLPDSERTVKVTIKQGRKLNALEGKAVVSLQNDVYNITVSGGDWFFGEF